MYITQKQFTMAKQNLDLELKEEDKYIEKWVDDMGGTLYYRKPDETYMAYGTVAEAIRYGVRSPGHTPSSEMNLEDLLDSDIDSLEKLNELVWDIIGEKAAVESSRTYTLSHPYKGYKQIMLMKGSRKIKVYSVKEASEGEIPEPLYVSSLSSFEEVIEELDYSVRT